MLIYLYGVAGLFVVEGIFEFAHRSLYCVDGDLPHKVAAKLVARRGPCLYELIIALRNLEYCRAVVACYCLCHNSALHAIQHEFRPNQQLSVFARILLYRRDLVHGLVILQPQRHLGLLPAYGYAVAVSLQHIPFGGLCFRYGIISELQPCYISRTVGVCSYGARCALACGCLIPAPLLYKGQRDSIASGNGKLRTREAAAVLAVSFFYGKATVYPAVFQCQRQQAAFKIPLRHFIDDLRYLLNGTLRYGKSPSIQGYGIAIRRGYLGQRIFPWRKGYCIGGAVAAGNKGMRTAILPLQDKGNVRKGLICIRIHFDELQFKTAGRVLNGDLRRPGKLISVKVYAVRSD